MTPSSTPYIPEILETRLIFVHVPKAAGTSVKTEFYGGPGAGHRRIIEFAAHDPGRMRDFFKFSFVRNPWDRLLSAHAYLTDGSKATGRDRRFAREVMALHPGFEAFVLALEDPGFRRRVMAYDHFRTQAYWLCMPGARDHAMDFLGRFERFDEDMEALRDRLGRPSRPAVRILSSDHPPYRDAYSARMRDIAGDIYARDVALFGYAF
ncbi:sulfotransferase family 2 domain-containing protein [Rhodovulum visakhapatnamense]|uniref:Sulfotransferase family 2 domain-containing protein n=1 Tax=Rhodovulum visakhapatnamense TaxID=364297 RepID=A0ABS1RAY6_9RHOB|nr:sulfotransferase family 2 domain-containing protein [Rhodovulum visakhapatnamense]MBL3568923.1 sulfotransferase family 2 domain-containing protein [Rhodovulum visakhapatnamense]MBL3576803.1 sulfotransferase family 2 domain-containing protein [Rhodovulum visakhapatnamense]